MESNTSAGRLLKDYLLSELGEVQDRKPGLCGAIYEYCLENRETQSPSFMSAQYERGKELLLKLLAYESRQENSIWKSREKPLLLSFLW